MRLDAAINLFLGEFKQTTAKTYAASLFIMRDWLGPARELSSLKPEMLVEFFQQRIYAESYAYAAATIQKHTKTVKTFFNWCVRIELITRSPAQVIRGKKLPRAISREKAMRDDELAKILDAVRYKPRDYALILFLADTGARRGGAAGLTAKDINWDKLIATVTEKGEKPRLVAFSPLCAQAIRHWLMYRSAHYRVTGVHIFTQDGQPMRPENISLIIRRAARVAGVRVLSSHSLRHRKGHQFADQRIAPSIAATALGHSDSVITISHYYPSDWDTAEKALRELMTNPSTLSPDDPKIVKFGSG